MQTHTETDRTGGAERLPQGQEKHTHTHRPTACSRLSVPSTGPDRIHVEHVGGAADESGERAAQQNHHTAGTRPENIGTDSQANG